MSGGFAAKGLDRLQRGHLRHFDNLSRQPQNDWSLMKGRSTGQDDFGGYRFQLAYMMYALALAHMHRAPAAPGLFKPIFERLFEKLLLPEVWMYWRDVSQGGSIFNAHLSDTYREEWNPVRRDNIMYSAYVQSCALLYHYLFRDDRYARPGSIAFRHWSYFWGGEPKSFEYDERSLNEHVYWLMAESGFLGVACEPNCIFQICNQPAILGFRLHDLVYGGSRAAEVVRSYEAAWADFGRTGDDGHFVVMLSADTHAVRPNRLLSPWVDAWTGALMNMWNRDFVRAAYPAQAADLIVDAGDGTMAPRIPERPEVMGQSIVSDDCDFGWAAVWTSELGDGPRLAGLLEHADRHMAPCWRDGGFYYPRNDRPTDRFGNRTLVEPHTGNVLLGYARLNVSDGLWRLYNEPLEDAFFAEPALVSVGPGVDLHAAFRGERGLSFKMGCAGSELSEVVIGRLGTRDWKLWCDGRAIASSADASGALPDFVAPGSEGITVRCPDASVHDFLLEAA